MKSQDERYPALLQARLPRELSEAVDVTARARFLTKSEYVRQALLKSLKDDGAMPQPRIIAAVQDQLKHRRAPLRRNNTDFVAHCDVEDAADYLRRGRRYGCYDLAELTNTWIACVKAAVERCERQLDLQDTCSEFSLRGITPPYDEVQKEFEWVQAEVRRSGVGPLLKQRIREYVDQRLKPPN